MGNARKFRVILTLLALWALLFSLPSVVCAATDSDQSCAASPALDTEPDAGMEQEEQAMNGMDNSSQIDLSSAEVEIGPRGIPVTIAGITSDLRVMDSPTMYAFLDGLKQVMQLEDPARELQMVGEDHDEYGTIYQLSQYHQDIPVYGCLMTVVVNPEGYVTDVTANLIPNITLSPEPKISNQDAISAVYGLSGTAGAQATLVYFAGNDSLGEMALCWKVSSSDPTNIELSGDTFIDANTGAKIAFWPGIIF